MKAAVRFGETNLKDGVLVLRKALKRDIQILKDRQKVKSIVHRVDFPCAVRYDIYSKYVEFFAPVKGWKNDKEFHCTLAVIVKQLGAKMERKFTEFGGKYYWVGKTDKGLAITLNDALTTANCEIVEYTDTQIVTKFKSICGKQEVTV